MAYHAAAPAGYLTLRDAAARLRVSYQTAYTATRDGRLPSTRGASNIRSRAILISEQTVADILCRGGLRPPEQPTIAPAVQQSGQQTSEALDTILTLLEQVAGYFNVTQQARLYEIMARFNGGAR